MNNAKNVRSCEEKPCFSQDLTTILDSSLIIGTLRDNLYNIKLVDCGEYIQVYYLKNKKVKKSNNDDDLNIVSLSNDKVINKKVNNSFKKIASKNINRSKFECQRLAKCNSKDWCTFITLTFADNITDISKANNEYKKFIYKIKRVFKEFKCLCVPEFQKRGAVHFHLLTNISVDNEILIYKQNDNKKFFHIKYWNNGFDSVEDVKGNMKKIIGYISKYMTKDIDDRLFSHHRYYYTRNLKRPIINYLNFDNKKHLDFYNKKIINKNIIYSSEYIDIFNNEKIAFREFLKTS